MKSLSLLIFDQHNGSHVIHAARSQLNVTYFNGAAIDRNQLCVYEMNMNAHAWNFNGKIFASTDRSQQANRLFRLLFIEIQFVYSLFSLIFDNLFWLPSVFLGAASKVSITFWDYRIGFIFCTFLLPLSLSSLVLLSHFISFRSHFRCECMRLSCASILVACLRCDAFFLLPLSCNFGHWFSALPLHILFFHSFFGSVSRYVCVCAKYDNILASTFFNIGETKMETAKSRELQSIFICYLLIVWIQHTCRSGAVETGFCLCLSLLLLIVFVFIFWYVSRKRKKHSKPARYLMNAATHKYKQTYKYLQHRCVYHCSDRRESSYLLLYLTIVVVLWLFTVFSLLQIRHQQQQPFDPKCQIIECFAKE